ncbi:MAG: hypothetical protein JO324_06805 [Candidatus Eremiobacteraeota bacterium]|nr:hypothetical protein [Candidatus Eremiobacteraeota bacterium]
MVIPKALSAFLAAATTLTLLASPAPAMARGLIMEPRAHTYAGNFPVTVTGTKNGDFTGCLTLRPSGFATLTIGTQRFSFGTFLVVNNVFVATIEAQGYAQNAGLLFIAPATRRLTDGVYEEVYGGQNFQSGALAFGAKGGC